MISQFAKKRNAAPLMPVRKKLSTRTIYLLLCLSLFACGQQSGQQTNKQSEQERKPQIEQQADTQITLTDFAGNTVTLEQPAKRIVALAPHIVENLYTIGAGDKIVGVVTHSDFPEEAAELPIVGGYEQTNFERIVQLKPDLIVAWESGNTLSSIAKLRELGFKVLIDQPNGLDDVAKSLTMLAKATGHNEQGNKAASDFLSKVNKARNDNANKRDVPIFYQVWNEPLISINGNHIISDAIRACGGVNILADEPAVAPRVNVESIIKLDPEAIIASGMGEARPEWLDTWRQWPNLTSVKRDNLFYVNPDHLQRHTVRLLLAIDTVCSQLDQVRAKQATPGER